MLDLRCDEGTFGFDGTFASNSVVGCKGGSRYVEGCWGFPYLKMKKVSWFLGSSFLELPWTEDVKQIT